MKTETVNYSKATMLAVQLQDMRFAMVRLYREEYQSRVSPHIAAVRQRMNNTGQAALAAALELHKTHGPLVLCAALEIIDEDGKQTQRC